MTVEERNEIIKDTVLRFAKYLQKHSCSYDLDRYHSFRAIDIDDLDQLVEEFLEGAT